MSRNGLVLSLLCCVGLVIQGCSEKSGQTAAEEALQVPPAEPRPASVRPAIKWLPESPRYQSVRREAFREGTDFKSRLDLGTERLSRRERYRVSIRQRPHPVLHEFQSWLVHIETADGKPVSDAKLSVNGGMPQHGHGLATQPRIKSEAGAGDYRIEGLQFNMPGWWEISLFVYSEMAQDDTVIFNTILE